MRKSLLILGLCLLSTQVLLAQQDGEEPAEPAGQETEKTLVPTVVTTSGWAVVIGIADYQNDGIQDLMFADQDAQDFYNLLTDPLRGAFDPSHVMILVNDEATYDNIKDALYRWLPERAAPEDLVVIFYSGHGASVPSRLGEGTTQFLLPYGCNPGTIHSTAISMIDEFPDWLRSIHYRAMVLIMDCCYSGAVKSPSFVSKSPATDEFLNMLAEPGRGRILLAASNVQQVAQESPQLGHGVFSHFLLEALSGAADYDKDTFVDVLEAYKYVAPKVETHVRENMQGGEQTPLQRGEVVEGVPRLTSAPPGPPSTTLQVNCSPWADVYLDGQLKGQTPLIIEDVAPGKHVLRLVNGAFELEEEIEVKEGELLPIARKLE